MIFNIGKFIADLKTNKTIKTKTMNKEDALRKLDSLEKEAKELRVIIEKADKPKPVIERIKSFEDAMNELGHNDEEVRLYNNMKAVGMPKHIIAEQRIVIFCKAMNEGKKHDWNNSSEYKYAPYFDMRNKPGFGFDFAYYLCSDDISHISSRLLYTSKEHALHAGKCMEQDYYDYLTNN